MASVCYSWGGRDAPPSHAARLCLGEGHGEGVQLQPLLVYLHGGFWKPEWDRQSTLSHRITGTFGDPFSPLSSSPASPRAEGRSSGAGAPADACLMQPAAGRTEHAKPIGACTAHSPRTAPGETVVPAQSCCEGVPVARDGVAASTEGMAEGERRVPSAAAEFARETPENRWLGRVATLDIEYSRVNQQTPERSEGGGGWPATFIDALAAINALAEAKRVGGAPDVAAAAARLDLRAVVLVGHSAGGAMALWLGMLSCLPADARAEMGETVRRMGGAAAAEAITSGFDPAIRVVGVVGLAPVADLRLGAAEGISDFHDAIQNLFWRFGPRCPAAALDAACPTALMARGKLPALAHAPHFLLIHGDADVDVPPSQSLAFAQAAWATMGDHPTWLLLMHGLDHLEAVGIGIDPESDSEGAQRWRSVQRAMRLFVGAVLDAERAQHSDLAGACESAAESELSALCCSSVDAAREFCARAKPHVAAAVTISAIEEAAAATESMSKGTLSAAGRLLSEHERKFSPPFLARGLRRWLAWNGKEPSAALDAWLAMHTAE